MVFSRIWPVKYFTTPCIIFLSEVTIHVLSVQILSSKRFATNFITAFLFEITCVLVFFLHKMSLLMVISGTYCGKSCFFATSDGTCVQAFPSMYFNMIPQLVAVLKQFVTSINRTLIFQSLVPGLVLIFPTCRCKRFRAVLALIFVLRVLLFYMNCQGNVSWKLIFAASTLLGFSFGLPFL